MRVLLAVNVRKKLLCNATDREGKHDSSVLAKERKSGTPPLLRIPFSLMWL